MRLDARSVLGLTLLAFASAALAQTPKNPDQPIGRVYDSYPHPNTRGALAYSLAERWEKTSLTFQFNNCPHQSNCEASHDTVRQAFADWQTLIPLTFTEVSGGADIEVTWSGAEEGFSAEGDVLAFAYFPDSGGDIFINDAISWQVGFGSDLYLVAAHEIGHSLGLDHSDDPAALMYPTSTELTTGIASDDVRGIQALYGTRDGDPPLLDEVQPPTEVLPSDDNAETAQADGLLDDSMPWEIWEIDAAAGETLQITMTRVDGDLQPFIGVLTYDEDVTLAESGGDLVASVVVTFPEDGTYVIVTTRQGYDNGSSVGRYNLDIAYLDDTEGGSAADSFSAGDYAIINVANYSGADLCELYISSTSSEEWGEDWLEGFPLADGEGFEIELPADEYDALALGCDGFEIESYSLSVGPGSSMEIYSDIIAIYP